MPDVAISINKSIPVAGGMAGGSADAAATLVAVNALWELGVPRRDLHALAAKLRRAFSGIVAGNVKEEGIQAIEQHGPFEIHGEPEIMAALDRLLAAFVAQQRMKLPGSSGYQPCYRVVS